MPIIPSVTFISLITKYFFSKSKFLITSIAFFSCLFNFFIFTPSGLRWGIGVFQLIIIFLAVAKLLDSLANNKSSLNRNFLFGYGFILYCLFTMLIPILFPGKIMVANFDANYRDLSNSLKPLRFSSQNYSQFLYLLFFVFSSNMLASFLTEKILKQVIFSFLLGGIIVIISGLFYQFFSTIGSFNHVVSVFENIFGGTNLRLMDKNSILGIRRMYSLAGEASFTSTFLILQFGAARFMAHETKNTIKLCCIFLSYFIIVIIFLSGSTSGILALIVLFVIYLITLNTTLLRVLKSNWYLIVPVVIFGIPIVKIQLPKILGIDYGSTIARLDNFLLCLKIFIQSPLFGSGIGSNRSSSMLGWLISNTGFIGLILAGRYVYILCKNSIRAGNHTSRYIWLTNVYLSYIITSLFTLPSGIFSFGYFIFFTSLMISLNSFSSKVNYANHNQPILQT